MAIKEQMELFELGGLADEGGTKDPVSGNDVPVGSTQKEVRDDIPAQLSEGEFVLPADVVRYHGLEKIMQLRDEAKQGLQKMEDMGQMGNSDEAILDDDVPFSLEDLDMEDVPEYNVGGVVQQQGFTGVGGYNPSQFAGYTPQYTQYQAPNVPTTYQMPQQQAVPTVPAGQAAPTFGQLFEGKAPTTGELDNREYINPETGEKRVFTFIGGTPSVPIPSGFVPVSEYSPIETPTTPSTKATTAKTVDREDKGDDADTQAEAEPYGGNVNTGQSSSYSNAVQSLAGYQLGSLSPTAALVSAIKGKINPEQADTATPNDLAVAMNSTRSAFVEQAGKPLSDLSIAELDQLGTAMSVVEAVVEDVGKGIISDPKRRATMIQSAIEASQVDPVEEAAKIEAARQRQRKQDIEALAAVQEEDDDVYGIGFGGEFGDGVYGGGGAGGFGVGTFGSGNTGGFNKGGLAKQMKKSGLTSKK